MSSRNHKKESKGARKIKKERESKLIENPKTALFIRGHKSSQVINDVMGDFNAMKKPFGKLYKKKKSNNTKGPFEDETTVEFFSLKNDASLFMYGGSSKKRLHNLIVGRMFDHHLLDMMEFGVTDFKPIVEFKSSIQPMYASKPAFILIGSLFQTDEKYQTLANLFVDFFRGEVANFLNLKGLDKVISLSVCENTNKVMFRHYFVHLRKPAGKTNVPQVELEEIGPSMDLELRRDRLASGDLKKASLKIPRELQTKKLKNVRINAFHDQIGRIHLPNQQVEGIVATSIKPKAIRTHSAKRKRDDEDGSERTTKKEKLDEQ